MENIQALPIEKINQFISNVEILEELATTKIPETLKQFKGFGGLGQCFWNKKLYGRIMRAIRANFGAENEKIVLENLRQSTKSAYYTPKEVINFMYRYLFEVCNFKGGEILEPACGNGAFFEHMPEHIKANSSITGIEYDMLTSKLAQGIYPEIAIINQGLQEVDFAGKKYDLIIGNPPYSDEQITDELMPDLQNYSIHHYFIAKCVRLLKDDGLLAFVMPSFFMDIPRKNTRHIIDNESVVIDVVRLPDNLFSQAKVTVDIIFLRKTGNKSHRISQTMPFNYEGNTEMVNKYWVNNPHRVLGKLKLKHVKSYSKFVPTCETDDKTQLLNFLETCNFHYDTLHNYQKIIGNNGSLAGYF